MTDAPNPADFSVNERPNEYEVEIEVRGSMRTTIAASSKADAEKKAEEFVEKLWSEEEDLLLDEADDIRVRWVYKTRPMYRVTRDGQKMQVSLLQAGDIPRQPDERGF